MTDLTNKLWGFCHTLRHDGIEHSDYIEQITCLLFLKMAAERNEPDLRKVRWKDETGQNRTTDCSWASLASLSGSNLLDHYSSILRGLARQKGILGDIFEGALNRFSNPANLQRLIALMDGIAWTALDADVPAQAFEGLLEKAASEGKKGAGQYFTPRPIIQTVCRVMKPDPRKKKDFALTDCAVGTAGFISAAYEWFLGELGGKKMPPALWERVRDHTYFGQELVSRPRRLALMNMHLRGLNPEITLGDSIDAPPGPRRYDVVLTNPPFGTKGASPPKRPDFVIRTSNKQLNFLQHIHTILKDGGRAAVVVPDNCLFADQAAEVSRQLAGKCNIHTILRLPDGCFSPYSPGTRTNVVFFTKGEPTERVWIYDARTGVPSITKKDRPLTPGQFAEFERCYGDDPNGHGQRHIGDSATDRWRSFTLKEIEKQDYRFDSLKWLRDPAAPVREDLDLVQLCDKIIGHLRKAIECVEALKADIMTWTCYAQKYNQPAATTAPTPVPAAEAPAAPAPTPEKRAAEKTSRKTAAAA